MPSPQKFSIKCNIGQQQQQSHVFDPAPQESQQRLQKKRVQHQQVDQTTEQLFGDVQRESLKRADVQQFAPKFSPQKNELELSGVKLAKQRMAEEVQAYNQFWWTGAGRSNTTQVNENVKFDTNYAFQKKILDNCSNILGQSEADYKLKQLQFAQEAQMQQRRALEEQQANSNQKALGQSIVSTLSQVQKDGIKNFYDTTNNDKRKQNRNFSDLFGTSEDRIQQQVKQKLDNHLIPTNVGSLGYDSSNYRKYQEARAEEEKKDPEDARRNIEFQEMDEHGQVLPKLDSVPQKINFDSQLEEQKSDEEQKAEQPLVDEPTPLVEAKKGVAPTNDKAKQKQMPEKDKRPPRQKGGKAEPKVRQQAAQQKKPAETQKRPQAQRQQPQQQAPQNKQPELKQAPVVAQQHKAEAVAK